MQVFASKLRRKALTHSVTITAMDSRMRRPWQAWQLNLLAKAVDPTTGELRLAPTMLKDLERSKRASKDKMAQLRNKVKATVVPAQTTAAFNPVEHGYIGDVDLSGTFLPSPPLILQDYEPMEPTEEGRQEDLGDFGDLGYHIAMDEDNVWEVEDDGEFQSVY
jgi:hypothetical protein